MKKILSLLALSLAAALPPAHAAVVSLDLIPLLGSSFDVQVQVNNVFAGRLPDDTVVAYGFNVTVGNPSVVSYLGEDPGPLFDDVSFLFAGNPMVAGLAQSLAGVAPGDFTGPLVLATLHFQALATGTSSIGVTYDPTDLNQGLVYANLPYGAISATTNATIPEPGGLTMGGLALAAICAMRIRRRARTA